MRQLKELAQQAGVRLLRQSALDLVLAALPRSRR